ncbi:hypothetical protein [Duncaniella muris]|uniref:hypothetical protein n=1 Tax=Duncaniella muris TaxID=2094150 RepID=UPI003F665D33
MGDTNTIRTASHSGEPWATGLKGFPKVKALLSAEWPSIKYYYENAVYGDGRHQAFLSLHRPA